MGIIGGVGRMSTPPRPRLRALAPLLLSIAATACASGPRGGRAVAPDPIFVTKPGLDFEDSAVVAAAARSLTGAAPFVLGVGRVAHRGAVAPVVVKGIDPAERAAFVGLSGRPVGGTFDLPPAAPPPGEGPPETLDDYIERAKAAPDGARPRAPAPTPPTAPRAVVAPYAGPSPREGLLPRGPIAGFDPPSESPGATRALDSYAALVALEVATADARDPSLPGAVLAAPLARALRVRVGDAIRLLPSQHLPDALRSMDRREPLDRLRWSVLTPRATSSLRVVGVVSSRGPILYVDIGAARRLLGSAPSFSTGVEVSPRASARARVLDRLRRDARLTCITLGDAAALAALVRPFLAAQEPSPPRGLSCPFRPRGAPAQGP